jgi:hypothetical protein
MAFSVGTKVTAVLTLCAYTAVLASLGTKHPNRLLLLLLSTQPKPVANSALPKQQ